MNKKLTIWGRDFELPVIYQNYPGEEVLSIQENTVKALENVNFSAAEIPLLQYIEKNNTADLNRNEITNIFKYVMPRSLLIARNNEKRKFALICNYKFDMEHGIAIVFENEIFKSAGPQDIIL